MSVKDTIRRQYVQIVDKAAAQTAALPSPGEGWISSLRQALGISVSQLANRAGVTRAAIYQAQRNEVNHAISLRQMTKLAEAMGGRFVYAIVPEGKVKDAIDVQAQKKARAIVDRASAHMALEDQTVSEAHSEGEIERLASELTLKMPVDFWDDEA